MTSSEPPLASVPPGTPWFAEIWKGAEYREPRMDMVRPRVDEICKRIAFVPGQCILDVGCGQGAELVELACRGAIATGVDLSEDMLAGAKRNAQARGVQVTWVREDMASIHWQRAFDAVMLRDCIFGVYDHQRNREILKGLMGAARPGGALLLEVYNRSYGMRHGIEHFLKYNPDQNAFEGVTSNRASGNGQPLPVTLYLMSAPEWRRDAGATGRDRDRLRHRQRRPVGARR